MTAETELLQFLSTEAALTTKLPALLYILGLTGTEDGLSFLDQHRQLLGATASLVHDPCPEVVLRTYDCLVNATSRPSIAAYTLEEGCKGLLEHIVKSVLENGNENVLKCAAILSNLTQTKTGSEKVWTTLMSLGKAEELLAAFVSTDSKSNRDHLGFVFSNLSQLVSVRRWFMDQTASRIQKMFPFLTLEASTTRKHGAVGTLRNCCFEIDYNEWLLGQEVDILPRLLYPLMGPEELDEDEMEKLPLDLQYLGTDKQREKSPEIRKMLIEAITQLCATKECRKTIKDSGAYYVLRELHKTETCRPVVVACENLVDILISDEPEPGMENLKEVEVPEHLVEKFHKYNEELLKE